MRTHSEPHLFTGFMQFKSVARALTPEVWYSEENNKKNTILKPFTSIVFP